MSKRPYECFRCRDNGYPNTMIYLAGKDEQGKTIQLEEDGTRHNHKTKEQQEQASSFHVSDESVDRGISAFSMMTDLIRLVEQTQKLLVTMDGKLDRLTNLVYAQQQQKQEQQKK